MMRALVTRPRADAAELARALEARGIEVTIEPMLEIVARTGVQVPLDGAQGLLVTSANGIRALAANTAQRDLPVFAVGEASAAEARRLGFARVEAAEGDTGALAELVAETVDPKRGALVHAAGSHQTGDLAGQLAAHGFEIRRVMLYEARAAETLSASLRAALAENMIGAALFFSPRTAVAFVTLARSSGLGQCCAAIRAYALSPAVAAALDSLAWRAIRVADRANQEAMLAAVDADLASARATD